MFSEVFEPQTFEPQSEPFPVMDKVTMQEPEPQMMASNGDHQAEEHGNHPEPQEFSNSEPPSGPHETPSQDQNEIPVAVPFQAGEPEPGMPF